MKKIIKVLALTAMVASTAIVPTASFAKGKPAGQELRAPSRTSRASPKIEGRRAKPIRVKHHTPAPKPVVVAPAPAPAVVVAEAPAPRCSSGLFGRIGTLVDDAIAIHEDIEHHNY